MDRLLFGDNQFFGVNHMSEEKARAQSMRFQSTRRRDRRARRGLRRTACAPSCARRTIASAQICDHVRANPERYADFEFYPCMPYAHKYANAVTEDGMLGALKRFLPDEGLLDAAIRGGASMAKKDIEGVTTLLIDAEMKMFEGLSTPVIFLQNVVVDLLLGLGFNDAFRIFADHVRAPLRRRARVHHDEPARAARRCSTSSGIENPIVCSNINKIGFRMCGGLEAYEAALRERAASARSRCPCFASGAIPADEAIEWVCAQPNVESIVFGASSSATSSRRATSWREHWGLDAQVERAASVTTLLVASTGGHLKQLHRLHRRLDGVEGPFRWATFDTPQSRSLLEGEDVDFVHFVGGRDPRNVLRNVPLARPDPARAQDRHDRQHGLGDGAAVLRARPRREAERATTSRARRAATARPRRRA